jgi:hypothetical protein
MSRILFLAVVAACAGCALHHEIPRAEIEGQLAARFPVEKTAGLWMVRIEKPRLRFEANNRAGVELAVLAGGVGVPTLAARADVEGTPEYRSSEGAFYLKDFTIRRLDLPSPASDVEGPLRAAIAVAIDAVLRERPVYVLDPKRSDTERLIKGHVQRIWVEQDRLVVEYHL